MKIIVTRTIKEEVVLPDFLTQTISDFLRSNQKIYAIKLLRGYCIHHHPDANIGLKEAKDMVEEHQFKFGF